MPLEEESHTFQLASEPEWTRRHRMHMSSPEIMSLGVPAVPEERPDRPLFSFENTYAHLPARFYARLSPTPVASPRLVKINAALAFRLGIDPERLASGWGVEVLAGNRKAVGSEPMALAYAGHQFGHFVPQLGDGRACLLGEIVGQDGRRYDVQLKGSGPTPFSRRGDGRATLGPVLREYLLSEAMAALGVPTTRALAAVLTGEDVFRDTMLPGAVLTRIAASHLRVGTFQYFAAQGDLEALRQLAQYAIARHYPEAASEGRPIRALLDSVVGRQAHLIAQWLLLGFVHGVMNTDNTTISGETIDYGPCAFLEVYDPESVYSSIDRMGRYAYGNQAEAAHWNLTRLAESLLPLLEEEEGSAEEALNSARASLTTFRPQFEGARTAGFRRKIGLSTERDGDLALIESLLECMAANGADFTLTFRRLCDAAAGLQDHEAMRGLFRDPGSYDAWAVQWRRRLREESLSGRERSAAMRLANPSVIPRNHMVEAALDAAIERGDLQPFEELLDAGSRPYEDRPELERYMLPARAEDRVLQTFCGT